MRKSELLEQTRICMGMPITVAIVAPARQGDIDEVFAYFTAVDERFSTYKHSSEIAKINRGERTLEEYSPEMREVFALAQEAKEESGGYFDMRRPDGALDPSGIVKGWAIRNAARLLRAKGYEHFYVNAGGDFEACGCNAQGEPWRAGIRNPFNRDEIVKVLYPQGAGVATSGTYVRGMHIYNPHAPEQPPEIVSLTVLAPDVCTADRLATAAFAMGKRGIEFIESTPHCEGYAIDLYGQATMTSGLENYIHEPTW